MASAPDTLLTVIARAWPALAQQGLQALGAGSDHVAYRIGDDWVLRFSDASDGPQQREVQDKLLQWLADALPVAVPVPGTLDPPEDGVPLPPYQISRYLPGVPALRLGLAPCAVVRLAPTLGTLLKTLHALPVERARSLGVPLDELSLDPRRDTARADLEFVLQKAPLAAEGRDAIRTCLQAEVDDPTPHCLVPGDFAAEQVMLSEAGDRIMGLIDWSDRVIGCRAHDLAGLYHWGGELLLQRTLQTYGEVPAATVATARWLALCRALADIRFGVEEFSPLHLQAGILVCRRIL